MCNSSNFGEDDSSEESNGPVVLDTFGGESLSFERKNATVRGLFQPEVDCIADFSEGTDDVFFGSDFGNNENHDLITEQQKDVILESLMRDLSNVGTRLETRHKTYSSDCKVADQVCVNTGNFLAGNPEKEERQTKNNMTVPLDNFCKNLEAGIVTNDLRRPLLPEEQLARVAVNDPLKLSAQGSDVDPKFSKSPIIEVSLLGQSLEQRRASKDELSSSTGDQLCVVKTHRKSRLTADRALALVGDEVRLQRTTRRDLLKRNASSFAELDGGLTCFVLVERLEDVVAKMKRKARASPTKNKLLKDSGENSSTNNTSNRNNDNNEELDIFNGRIVINNNNGSNSKNTTRHDSHSHANCDEGDNLESREQKPSMSEIQEFAILRQQEPQARIWANYLGAGIQTRSSKSNIGKKEHNVNGFPLLPEALCQTNVDSGDPVFHSEDDGDPRSFADLFGNSSRTPQTTGQDQRSSRPDVLMSSLACTFMSVASTILSTRKRLETSSTPCRCSGRMLSRDSGFVDSEDSRASIIDSNSRLDDYWIRRRKHWEVTDIREEVRELLGFIPDDSPPPVLAPVHIPSGAQKVVTQINLGTKRRASKTLKKAVTPSVITTGKCNHMPKSKRARTLPAALDEGNLWQNRKKSNVTVSKRSGRSIRPAERMDM